MTPVSHSQVVEVLGSGKITYLQLLKMEIPQQEAILEPIFQAQSINMIYSWRGVGKTRLAMEIAWAVATGGQILGWKAPRSRKVLYVDGELRIGELQGRVEVIQKSSEMQPSDESYFCFLARGMRKTGMPDLSTPEGQKEIEKEIGDAEVIILDNVSTLFRTKDENGSVDWASAQDWLLELRARGITVILLHHEGKKGTQRGTSRREDVLDVVIHLVRPRGYKPEMGAVFDVHFEKNRSIFGDAVESLGVALETTSDGLQRWTRGAARVTPEMHKAIKLHHEGHSNAEIARLLHVNKTTIGRWLKKCPEN